MSAPPELPDVVNRAFAVSRKAGYVSFCRNETGRLLATLAATRGGTLAEFGTAFMSSVEKVGFHRIADDVMRVAGWGVSQNFIDPSRIFLIGASVGGSGALLAAPRFTGLRGVLTLAAAGALAFGAGTPAHIRTGLESLGAPVLLASSEGDAFDGAANVRDWSDGLDHVTPLLVPGTGHGMAIYYDVRDEVVEFIKGRA